MARGEAAINRCAPGGARGIEKLAQLLNQPVIPLDPAYGEETPPEVAFIHEDACIGCTKCIDACPVDAIIGASKQMHTVIADLCTGCGLCVPACPVDCIDMIVRERPLREIMQDTAAQPQDGSSATGVEPTNPPLGP